MGLVLQLKVSIMQHLNLPCVNYKIFEAKTACNHILTDSITAAVAICVRRNKITVFWSIKTKNI